jgi:excinuclease ABC subunit C
MFSEKLSLVPELPGSYQMKDKDGIIIYVGKAKNLKRRLKSYFTRTVTGKTKVLVSNIADFEYIVTSSELESLILEITLIKKYNPKYNVLLKDDKSYPYIELTNEKYPTLKVVRNVKIKKNKNNLFGPYPNVGSAKRTVNMLNRLYPLRKCDKLKKDVCLYYHLGECLGYCKYNIPSEKTNQMYKEIKDFLNGNNNVIENKIKVEMQKCSDAMNFEKALEYKNMLNDIKVTLTDQKISLNKDYNFDLFNYYQNNNFLSIQVFFIRSGVLFGREQKIINTFSDGNEALTEYIIKFYEHNVLPKEIIVPSDIDYSLLSEYFTTTVSTREKGDIKKLLDLAHENAKIHLDEHFEELNRDLVKREEAINELSRLLGGVKVNRMESFDNSHLFGTYYVGGMVVFDDFIPLRNEYRKFKVDVSVKDDLSAMREVVYRRYYRVLMENLVKPDLIVVDGGELQVNVVKEIIDDLNLGINIIGLKKDNHHKTSAIIDRNLNEINIDSHSNLFLYLANIQEEVHRYAITYHREIKNKGMLSSILELVPGIGESRRKDLLRKFSSLKKIREASVSELSEVLPNDVAKSLYDYLKDNCEE